MSWSSRMREMVLPPDPGTERGVEYWRERLYHFVVGGLVGLGFFAAVPSVWLSLREGLYALALVDALAYAFVVLLFFWRGASYKGRATLLFTVAYLLGVVVFLELGEVGAGLYWLFVVPPLASMLVGLRSGTLFLGANLLFVLGTGYLVHLDLPNLPHLTEQSLEVWMVTGANFLVANALITVPLGALLDGMLYGWRRVAEESDLARSSQQRYRALFKGMLNGYAYCRMVFDERYRIIDFEFLEVNLSFKRLTGLNDVVGKRATEVIPGIHESNPELFETYGRVARSGQPEQFEAFLAPLDIWLSISVFSPVRDYFIIVFDNITERRRSRERMERRLAELQAINTVSTLLREATSLDGALSHLLDATLEAIQVSRGMIWLYDEADERIHVAVARGVTDGEGREFQIPPEKPGEGLAGVVFASGEMHTSNDYSQEESIPEDIRQRIPPGVGGVTVPIRSENDVIGVLAVNTQMPQVVEEIQVNLLKTLVEIAGSAIQRLALHEQTERQVQRLLALSKIDLAITSNIALQPTLEVILSQVIEQLHVDAAAILRHDPLTQELIPIVQSGFRSPRTRLDSVRVGEGCAGRAISERRTVRIADLSKRNNNLRLAPGLSEEGFVSYIGVPLLVKGEVQGVLEIFHRSPLERDQEWHDFLNSLAGQTAIAVDNASLFEGLRKSNLELSQAYDATIEGWSRALDLRDRETEGHTQRVTQLTMRLARRMRVPENELADMRRGALLHDIGKMGIPDSILLKPAALTDLEWEIMKQHPTYARDLLSPMENLRDALDIPYCHHEKWDGSGYPRGLKGEEIPQAARIFAVADVYDALTSDRPYRKGWSKTKAIKYIKGQSGQHFDPDVIKVFLETVLPTKAL